MRSGTSKLGQFGGPAMLLAGRKSTRRRTCSSASTSLSHAPSATDDLVVWTFAPPSSSAVTVSFVTVFTTSGRDEHVARVPNHEDEVGERGAVDVAARARAHDDGDLRDDAGGDHVAAEDFAITAERRHALLDAGAARVEEADDRRTHLERHVLDLGDLGRVRLRQRAAEDREVLCEDEDGAAVDGAPPVTTPSPGILACLSMPKSVQRCCTKVSNSSKESLSSSSSMRSRAVSLPRWCCASMRFCPPPRRASWRRWSSFSRMSFIAAGPSVMATSHMASALLSTPSPDGAVRRKGDAPAGRAGQATFSDTATLLRVAFE